MEAAFGASDAEGAWVWKHAYEACEAAQVLFLRKFGGGDAHPRGFARGACSPCSAGSPARLPSQTRRSEESERFQQFSTPIALGFVAAEAAAIDRRPISCSNPRPARGLLAIFAELAEARLALNEIADTRAGLLDAPVPRRRRHPPQRRADPRPSRSGDPAERRADEPALLGVAHVEGRFAEAAIRHISSALARLAEGGRLVAITGRNVGPDQPAWRDGFVRLQEKGRVVFSAAIAGQAYARHGTTIETRLTVIDRVPADDPQRFPSSPGMAADAAELLDWVTRLVPPRAPVTGADRRSRVGPSRCADRAPRPKSRARSSRSSSARRRCRISSSSPTRPAIGRRPKAPA